MKVSKANLSILLSLFTLSTYAQRSEDSTFKASYKSSNDTSAIITNKVSITKAHKKKWFTPLRNTSYWVGPNAFQIDKGEIRYTNYFIVGNIFDLGMTKNLSLKLGSIITNEIVGIIGLKYSVKATENFRVALNANYGFHLKNDEYVAVINKNVVVTNLVGTWGSESKNFSVGIMWMPFEYYSDVNMPVVQLGGMKRLSRKVALSFDTYLSSVNRYDYYGDISSDYIVGTISYGIKLLYPKSHFDAGLFRGLSTYMAVPFPLGYPYARFTTRLSKK
jgi:hypothetical protein